MNSGCQLALDVRSFQKRERERESLHPFPPISSSSCSHSSQPSFATLNKCIVVERAFTTSVFWLWAFRRELLGLCSACPKAEVGHVVASGEKIVFV